MFTDRKDAGRKLLKELERFRSENPLILAVPRGGVVIAHEMIKELALEWDLIIPRKIGAPHNKEVAIGAVSYDGSYFTDEGYVDMLGVSNRYIEEEAAFQLDEIKRRMREYRGTDDFPNVKDRTVIIVDDGIATGFTILAAIKSIKKQGANKVIVAVPVAPRDTVEKLSREVDEVICLEVPEEFYAVGMHYKNFSEVSDEEVAEIINDLGR
ncbi:MAG TPA: phosphoribosyltransferase family protein [Clostridia bacterium]|nr:phosphoribosyltransferase family protein [Clostridia bacterium]